MKKTKLVSFIDKYLMVISTIFFSGAFIAGKFSVKEFPPFSLTFFRFLIASLIIFGVLVIKDEQWKIKKQEIPLFLSLGIIGMVGYHIFFFLALKYTSAVNTSLIAAMNPIITTTLSIIFLREKISKRALLGIAISFLGVLLIVTNGSLSMLVNLKLNIGDILMVIAVLCFSTYFIMLKGALKKHSPLKCTSYAFLFCTLALTPFTFYEISTGYLRNTTLLGWSSIFYMAIFCSVIGYLIQQISIKNIGPSKTSLYVNLTPIFSMILAYFILKEQITFIKIFAAALIILGVYLNMKLK